jgi:hypothetical protein
LSTEGTENTEGTEEDQEKIFLPQMARIYADEMLVFVFICEHLRNLWLMGFLSGEEGDWWFG